MKLIKRIKNKKIILALFLMISSIVICTLKYTNLFYKKINENKLISNYYEEQKQLKEDIKSDINIKVNNDNKYIAVLKIPKINLEKGLSEKNSYYNNVNRNIEILKESDNPETINGNIILASHSGNSVISYFKNLHKLTLNDEIIIIYKGFSYKYKIVNIYEIEKNGKANIIRNTQKNTLTLITCKRTTNNQIVIISELIEKEEN